MVRLSRKAQSTAEYVIVLGLIVAAVVAMQTYVKRGLQARMRDATDYVDEGAGTIFKRTQYEPYYMTSNIETTRNVAQDEALGTSGTVNKTLSQETIQKSGSQTISTVPDAAD